MKRTGMWLLLASLGMSLGGACGQATSSDELGGETHWLRSCNGNDAAECGPNLECVCGVCTSACAEDASCAGISAEARCAARETTSYASDCAASAPPRLCVRTESPGGDGENGTLLYGRRYDERGCFGAQEIAGYAPSAEDRDCSAEVTYASNGPDTCWLFPNSCLPEGFALLSPFVVADGCTDVRDLCPESLSCGAEEVATVEGCFGCDDARRVFSTAVSRLAARFDACNSDVDCAAHEWQTGCDGLCPVAVNASNVDSFDAAVTDLSSGYCTDTADWAATCGRRIVDCNVVPLCRAGRCVISGDAACADRSLTNCEADGDCVLASAFPYDPQSGCFAEVPVAVGCVDPDLSCPPSTRTALDGNGNCYSFGGCLPAGFQQAPDDHACNTSTTCGG
jgi:hypothetical protein